MTEQEAEPFKPELRRLLKTHKYHFEYVRPRHSPRENKLRDLFL